MHGDILSREEGEKDIKTVEVEREMNERGKDEERVRQNGRLGVILKITT